MHRVKGLEGFAGENNGRRCLTETNMAASDNTL